MREEIVLIIGMVYLHIVADFSLQGQLGNLKQKAWWKENYSGKLYSKDWITSLIIHSFSWTTLVMLLPIIYSWHYNTASNVTLAILFVLNVIAHSLIDNIKANKLKISLTQDQLMHIVQIIITWLIVIM